MKKLFLIAAALWLFVPAQAQWDITLPEYSVEAAAWPYSGQVEDWGVNYLKSKEFWVKSKGQGAIIFICDTGIETEHQDLRDRVILQYGKDFTGSGSGYQDRHGHGTHCAGIAAATNNEFGVLGNAPMAYLVPVKVLNDQGSGTYEWIASGLRYVADLPLTGQYQGLKKVCSLSLGGGSPSTTLESAIDYAIAKGVFIIVAAGNSGCNSSNTIGYPGRYGQCITIASTGQNEIVSGFSSCGEQIDVTAPGEQIYSCGLGGGYVYLSGTSMATPGVAGVVANIVSAYPAIKNQGDLERFLRARAHDINVPGFDIRTGYGTPIMTGYLAPPDDGGENPPPPPPDTGDPVRETRTITLPIAGNYSYIWKASNETGFHRATVTSVTITSTTRKWSVQAAATALAKTDGFFAGGSRGFGLLKDADLYESGRWAAYFHALLTRDPDNTYLITGMTVKDEVGTVVSFDYAKDKVRDLPKLSTVFTTSATKRQRDLVKAARRGGTTWVK